MTSAKEQFGLSAKPEIHGIVERENVSVPADDYSAKVDAELNKKSEPVAKAKNGKIAAYKIAVSGSVRKSDTMESYNVTVTIPQCPENEMQYHIQNFVDATTKIAIAEQDVIDVRERGYIGKFQGVPVVVMPQSFTDETNTKLAMNPSFAFQRHSSKIVFPFSSFDISSISFRGWGMEIIFGKIFC